MEIRNIDYFFPSSNGNDEIYVKVCLPEAEPLGYVQIVHDSYEHIDIYQETMETFARNGYLTFGHDIMGHGRSVKDAADLGKMKGDDLFVNILEDVNRAFVYVFDKHHPEKAEDFSRKYSKSNGLFSKKEVVVQTKKPPIHAMIGIGTGSAIVKNYAVMFKDVNCVVLCGDRGYPITNLTRKIEFDLALRKNGPDSDPSELVRRTEKNYLKGIEDDYRFAYKTSVQSELSVMKKDPYCNFEYDLRSYKALMDFETSLGLSEWIDAYPLFLTTYVISGKKDPVNNGTRNLNQLINYVKQNKVKNWFYKYYDGYHNLFLEKNRKEVKNDILTVINAVKNQQYGNS